MKNKSQKVVNKLTNKYNLPQTFYDAVKNDDYTKGDSNISVTELISPPRKIALEEKHAGEIEEDVSDKGDCPP